MTYKYVAIILTHLFVIINFIEEKNMKKIPFTIKFIKTKYTKDEVYNFKTCTQESPVEGNFENEDQKQRYIQFLDDFLKNKIKPTTLVDLDIFKLFLDDLANRASIDYLEDNYDIDEDPEIVKGGFYFHQKSKQLKRVYLEQLN